ncbi:MAG TPA: hemerythrin domain-containing protein [Pyrinomonadaceae bacterium]|nr:hemerythrin domain-containing protein [Pyrinomonadaceae bacterium]
MRDLLERDHEELDGVLRELFLALDGGDKDESFVRLDLLWARLAIHIRAEHICLFPAILGAPQPLLTGRGSAPSLEEAQSAIGVLRRDHDFFMHELAKAINLIRALKGIPDAGAVGECLREVRSIVQSVKTRLRAHNQLEEDKVYGLIDVLLNEAERSTLDTRVRRELENLPPRFTGAGENLSS